MSRALVMLGCLYAASVAAACQRAERTNANAGVPFEAGASAAAAVSAGGTAEGAAASTGGVSAGAAASTTRRGGADSAATIGAASAPATPGDTARGVVTEVGNAPITTLLLVPVDSTRDRVALAGAAVPMLRNAVGLEIVVRGRLTNNRVAAASPRGVPVFAVTQFEVRAADGQPAHDGIVTLNRNEFSLRLGDGRMVRVVAMPTLLRDKVGARVFLVGKLDQPPLSYGILAEAK